MPTYEYECDNCGPFTEIHPMVEFDRPQPCPDCGTSAPRLLTLPAIGASGADGARMQETGAAPARAHPGGCGCCAAPRRFSAEAV